jgi:hypothetical protein
MRATIRDLIISDGALTALIPSERWFSPGGLTDVPLKPFAVLRWLSPVASNAKSGFMHQLRVDVHDERGSYDRIEQILGDPYRGGGVYAVLDGILGVTGSDGYVGQCDYLGHSGDQEEPEYGSNYKFSSWQILGRTA